MAIYVDEVGRGCCAGPVLACAVFLDMPWAHPKVTDSKKMSLRDRESVFAEMSARMECGMLTFSVGMASPEEIDSMNILKATYLAMHRAILPLASEKGVSHVVVDGDRFESPPGFTHDCVVKGDLKIFGISLASVAAKVIRDRLMSSSDYHGAYPEYHWDKNKGYGTERHLEAIRTHGFTPHHRMSFELQI